MSNFNLPPGCSVNDLPGNTPEDVRWDEIVEGFYSKTDFTTEERKITENLKDSMDTVICKAIQYGINEGILEAKQIEEENKHYDKNGEEK